MAKWQGCPQCGGRDSVLFSPSGTFIFCAHCNGSEARRAFADQGTTKDMDGAGSGHGVGGGGNKTFQSRARRLLLPILGSVAGTVLLAIQTYILHQQTMLLASQTDLLGIDQSVHIRERIVGASRVDDNVRRLISAMKSEANIQIGAPSDFGGALKVTDFSVDACRAATCSDASVDGALRAVLEPNSHLDQDLGRGLLRLSAFLQHLESAMRPLLEAPHELDLKNEQDKLVSLAALVTSGVTQCFFDPPKGRDLSENMARLRLVSANAFWVAQPVASPIQFRAFAKKFPQVGTNTQNGIIKLQAAVEEVVSAAGKNARSVTMQDFTSLLADRYRSALLDLIDLDKACTETIARDSADLKLISGRTGRQASAGR